MLPVDPSLNLPGVIGILGFAQGLFLAVFLLTQRKQNLLPNRLLAFLILLVALTAILHTIYLSRYLHIVNFLVGLRIPISFLIGPALFLYVKSLTTPAYRTEWKTLFHAVPFLISLVHFAPVWLGPESDRIAYAEMLYRNQFPELMQDIRFIRTAHIWAYTVAALVPLYRHRRGVLSTYSNLEGVSLKWLGFLVIALVINIPIAMFLANSGNLTMLSVVVALIYPAIIYVIAYVYLRHPEIHSESVGADPKYSKSRLNEQRALDLKRQVEELFLREKPYTDPDFTAHALAQRLGISPHNLSFLLNEVFKQSFYDFVNGYRIEEAQRLLLSDTGSRFTVLAIGLEVGFRSKSTFNAVFKKSTGMTPTAYRATRRAS